MGRTSQIIRRAKRKKSPHRAWSKEQELLYRDLTMQLEARGFVVRREELKRGHCWKVVSGSCRSFAHHYVFVDSRLGPQDQLSFLQATLAEMEDAAVGGADSSVPHAA